MQSGGTQEEPGKEGNIRAKLPYNLFHGFAFISPVTRQKTYKCTDIYTCINILVHPHIHIHTSLLWKRCGALWVFFFLFFFRTTQKFTVTERSDVGLFDPSSLESFPELAGYADSTLSRPLTGSPPGNRPKQRRGKRGGADQRLRQLG